MDECEICGVSKEAHEADDINHQFSQDGSLVPKPPKKASTPRQGLSGGDVMLRLITVLRSKGILTSEDLGAIFTEPNDAAGRPQR